MPSTFKAAKKKKKVEKDDTIHICPNCGSEKTNQVSLITNFCMECDIEFNFKTNKMYTIKYNGDLADYYVNEFMDCG